MRSFNLKSMEIEQEVQACWEKYSVLEKEIPGLKSKLSRLETRISKLQSRPTSEAKVIEGEMQEAITSLKNKVDKSTISLDTEIMGHEADKQAFTNQGLTIKRLEEKNIDVEKELAELKTRIDEVKSFKFEIDAVMAELKRKILRQKGLIYELNSQQRKCSL